MEFNRVLTVGISAGLERSNIRVNAAPNYSKDAEEGDRITVALHLFATSP